MAADSTEKWIRFFSKAGIPSRAATTYALTFADNRIQMDMLLDLNKEYLRDMGITLMGDVIAILRHARQVHEELTHEKLLYSAKSPAHLSSESAQTAVKGMVSSVVSVPSKGSRPLRSAAAPNPKSASSSSANSSSASPPSPAPAPRPLPHTTKKAAVTPASRSVTNPVPVSVAVPSGSLGKSVSKRPIASSEPTKRKLSEVKSRVNPTKEIVIDDDDYDGNDCIVVPVKKVRRVLPEHEGGYKIKMPSGTTPRSQQILAKQKDIASKKTVFDRLGQSSSLPLPPAPSSVNTPAPEPPVPAVSSTTSDPVFAVTGLGSAGDSTLKKKSTSVFSRLGDKQVSSTSTNRDDQKSLANPSMVADSVSSPVRTELKGRLGSTTPSVRSILSVTSTGVKPKRIGTESEGILAKHSVPISRAVKARLGGTEVLCSTVRPSPTTQTVVLASKKLKVSSVNGSSLQPVKKVSFSCTASVSSKAGVFSRLGR